MQEITAETLLDAYCNGWFPMADDAKDEEIFWYCPEQRGVLPLEEFHLSKNMAKMVRNTPFMVEMDRDFRGVMELCAESTDGRPVTWINKRIVDLYCQLHEMGFAHSVEVYDGDVLVGGLYGVAIGGAFFGESMFSRETNASKLALVKLVDQLRKTGFLLLDTQYVNDHLLQFGVKEIDQKDYMAQLDEALLVKNHWKVG